MPATQFSWNFRCKKNLLFSTARSLRSLEVQRTQNPKTAIWGSAFSASRAKRAVNISGKKRKDISVRYFEVSESRRRRFSMARRNVT